MLDIKPEYLDELLAVFNRYCPKAEIWAYGSRIKNNSHSGSDLDLVVKSFGEDGKFVSELKELITKSDIPFLVDLSNFADLPQSFKAEIMQQYEVIYLKGKK